nr:MAG TPA: hypothetical protein [Caudoviricetes sp.]
MSISVSYFFWFLNPKINYFFERKGLTNLLHWCIMVSQTKSTEKHGATAQRR